MRLARNARDPGSIPVEALNFLVCWNPLLHLVPNKGFPDLFVWSKWEDTLSPEGGKCDGGQLPWWPSSCDARPECERPGFDPPLRH